jgi:DNA topoisomerase IB
VEGKRRLHEQPGVDAVELPPELRRLFAATDETDHPMQGQRQDAMPFVGAER